MPFFGETLAMVDDEGFERPNKTARLRLRQATFADWPTTAKGSTGNRFAAIAKDDM